MSIFVRKSHEDVVTKFHILKHYEVTKSTSGNGMFYNIYTDFKWCVYVKVYVTSFSCNMTSLLSMLDSLKAFESLR